MSNENFNKEILNKLNTLIKISVADITRDKNLTEKILFLGNMGFFPKEISEMINTTPNYVSLILSKNRTKKKKQGGSSQQDVVGDEMEENQDG
jgi:hypothetical protein